MKLCMIAPVPPPYGGISNWYQLCKSYMEAHLSHIKMTTVNIAPKLRTTDGRTFFDRIVGSGLDMLKKRRELKQIIKNDKPDIIHMTTSGQLAIIRDIALLKIIKKHSIPAVYHIRFGRIPEISKANNREWKMIRKAMSLSTLTIAIDFPTLESIGKYAPDINAALIPNPIDIDTLPKKSEQFEKTVLFLGWVVKTKGIEELIDVWNSLGASYPDWTLDVAGPGDDSYIASLKKKCAVENIRFLGELSHKEAMERLSCCGLFVLPSYSEGFPNAVLEAMALGRPILATNVGAIPDMLSGGCGVTVAAQSVTMLKEAMESMLTNPAQCREYGKKALEKALKMYSIEQIFEQYIAAWNSILKKS